MQPLPVGFVAHGSPSLALDADKGADLRRWARSLPTPEAILVVSAHWEHAPARTGTVARAPLIYDFYGFPEPLYRIEYPAPGAPALAGRVAELLARAGRAGGQEPDRGLDHGVWVPLLHMYPAADRPVLQVSLPSRAGPEAVYALGRALAPLREEGVLLLGSGVLVHNLRALGADGSPVPEWARRFDEWCRGAIERFDVDALLGFRSEAPEAARAHPSDEHFLPLLFALGAGHEGPHEAGFPVQGFEYGSLSRRCVQLG